MSLGKLLGLVVLLTGVFCPVAVRAQSARISGLTDVNFGTITGTLDQTNSQNVAVCSYKNNPHRLLYSVTANGSGSGGSFQLSSGSATLAYDVQWADSPGQTTGVMLQPGVPTGGLGNAATGFTCPQQPDTAILIVTIRSGDLATASAGNYTGTLQLTVAPE
jgi:spore coat protein U-like protein